MNEKHLPAKAAAATTDISEVSYRVGDEDLTLSFDLVRKYCVQGQAQFVTEPELAYFLTECKARKLNPLRRECFLIKYSQKDNAQIIEAIGSKRNRARRADDCQGWTKGILLMDADGNVSESEYPFVPNGKTLIGGYFRATPIGWTEAFSHYVDLKRYIKKTSQGQITAFWQPDKQPEMIRKVAESQGLTALWGDQVGSTHIAEEFPPDAEVVDAETETEPDRIPETETPQDVGTEIYGRTDEPPEETNGRQAESDSSGPTANSKPRKETEPPPQDERPEDDEPRERKPAWTGSNAPREYPPPDASDALPFDQPPPVEDDPPTGAPLSWWDISKNWKHRRGIGFYLLVRIGLGMPFAVRSYQTDGGPLEITANYEGDYNKLKKEFGGAWGGLHEARPDVKRGVMLKLKTAVHLSDESIENFKTEIEMSKGE